MDIIVQEYMQPNAIRNWGQHTGKRSIACRCRTKQCIVELEGRGRPTKASFNVVAVKAYFVHEAESKRQLTVRCVVVTVMIF